MHTQLLSIAAGVALALAGSAFAQTGNPASPNPDKPRMTRDAGPDQKPAIDRKARKAEHDRIEADYKADKAKCGPMKGNAKEVCEADAKGKEKVAKAELEQKYEPSDSHARKVDEAKAEHQYNVAKEKCDAAKGKEEDACEKEAKAKYERAKADIKARFASKERKAATGSTSK